MSKQYANEVNESLTSHLMMLNNINAQYIRRQGGGANIQEEVELNLRAILNQMHSDFSTLAGMPDDELPDIRVVDPSFDSYRSYLAFIENVIQENMGEVNRALEFLATYSSL